MNEINKAEEKVLKYNNKRIRFMLNILKFCIGIFLLFVSFQYVNSHPAERTSIFSGFSVLYENTRIFIEGLFTGKSSVLDDKYKLEKNYLELIKTFESSNCGSLIERQSLRDKYEELKNLNVKVYQQRQIEFYDFAYQTNKKLQEQCK